MFWSCLAFERNADFRSPIAGKISMTFRTFTIAALAAAGLVMADARQAAAQRIPSHYRFVDETQSLGAFVSHIWTDRGIVDLGPNSGIAFGARYSIRISGPFVAEGEALVFPTSRWMMRLQEVGSDTITTKVGETDLTLLGLSGGLRFDLTGPRTYRNLLPYLMASAGAAIRLSSDPDANAQLPADQRYNFGTSFAGQVGGGVELFLRRRLAIRTDARVLFWQLKAPGAFVTSQDIAPEEWVQNYTVSVGASYRF